MPNPLRYRGAVFESATGLYYTGRGYYDPTIGRSRSRCKDIGSLDSSTGEDRCGEDENPYDDNFSLVAPLEISRSRSNGNERYISHYFSSEDLHNLVHGAEAAEVVDRIIATFLVAGFPAELVTVATGVLLTAGLAFFAALSVRCRRRGATIEIILGSFFGFEVPTGFGAYCGR